MSASWDPGFAAATPSIHVVGIDDLRSGAIKLGGVTPTAGDFVCRASDIRNGSLEVSARREGRYIQEMDIELEFEEGRRKYAPRQQVD